MLGAASCVRVTPTVSVEFSGTIAAARAQFVDAAIRVRHRRQQIDLPLLSCAIEVDRPSYS